MVCDVGRGAALRNDSAVACGSERDGAPDDARDSVVAAQGARARENGPRAKARDPFHVQRQVP